MNTEIRRSSPWPYVIILSFVCLAAFDGVVVTKALQTATGTTTDRPYEDGLNYEATIQQKLAAAHDGVTLKIDQEKQALKFDFAGLSDMQAKVLKVNAMKPDNKNLDTQIQVKNINGAFYMDTSKLKPGLWQLKVSVSDASTEKVLYYFENWATIS